MKAQTTVLALVLSALLVPGIATAFETDQYNLPPKPLADIGVEVTNHVELKLRKAVDRVNAEILMRQKCLAQRTEDKSAGICGSRSDDLLRLEYLRSEDAIAREAFAQLGDGVPPFTRMGTWMDSHHFLNQ